MSLKKFAIQYLFQLFFFSLLQELIADTYALE